MIDEKKLIEDIKNTFSDSVLNQTFGFGKYSLLEALEEIINRQPQIVTDTNVGSKWLPVEERLPKEMEEVLVSRKNSKTGTSIGYYNKVFGWYDQCLLRTITDVVAWMPKPKSYKKEGAE